MTGGCHDEIRRYYAAAARGAEGAAGCTDDGRFGAGCYEPGALAGLPAGAVAASLGCGNPTAVADLGPGETVLDLGSGGGLDVILSARRVGPTGVAYGLDMTPEVLAVARANVVRAGVGNVELLEGHIEAVPLPDASVDVVVSNCVINLSPDKGRVFGEIARVLRPGGRVAVSDVVAGGDLTPERRAELGWSACAAGALTEAEYRRALSHAGLVGVSVEVTHDVGDGVHGAVVRAHKAFAAEGDVSVRRLAPDDWDAVRAIYEAGMGTGDATFEAETPDWETWDGRHLREHRLVAVDGDGTVLGWVAASPVSERCVYGGVVEHSIYVHPDVQRRGIGRLLLDTFVAGTERAGIWTVQSGIFAENTASLALHQRCGFRVVGTRERLGRHQGRWRDVVLVERRSPVV